MTSELKFPGSFIVAKWLCFLSRILNAAVSSLYPDTGCPDRSLHDFLQFFQEIAAILP